MLNSMYLIACSTLILPLQEVINSTDTHAHTLQQLHPASAQINCHVHGNSPAAGGEQGINQARTRQGWGKDHANKDQTKTKQGPGYRHGPSKDTWEKWENYDLSVGLTYLIAKIELKQYSYCDFLYEQIL